MHEGGCTVGGEEGAGKPPKGLRDREADGAPPVIEEGGNPDLPAPNPAPLLGAGAADGLKKEDPATDAALDDEEEVGLLLVDAPTALIPTPPLLALAKEAPALRSKAAEDDAPPWSASSESARIRDWMFPIVATFSASSAATREASDAKASGDIGLSKELLPLDILQHYLARYIRRRAAPLAARAPMFVADSAV